MSSMVAKTINVIKNSSNKGDTTDIALMVSTSSKAEINPWDKSKIVNSLIIETGASTELAQEIADAVEQKILDSNLKNVTTSIIRELIDIELIERDLPMMHKRHSHLGLPMYDVEQIIFNANKENSNTTHNPESINLTLAEALLKEYALRKVFAEDVAQAHMIGDIHLHDLGFIVRPYTFMGDSVVLAKKKGDFEKLISIKQFYDGLSFEFQAEEGVWIKQPISNLYILDRDGEWTKVIQLTKKQKNNKRMYFVRTSDGKQQVVTNDHPMITTEGIKPCGLLNKGDRLITQDYQFKNYGIASINLVEEFAAAGVSGERYNVCLGHKIPLRLVKKDIYQGDAYPEHYEGAVLTLTKGTSEERVADLPLTAELGWVLGFYIAEGHQSEHSVVFTCEGEGKAKLIENLRVLNIPYEQKKRADRIVINDILIRDLFINVWKVGEKAREKSLPPDILNYSLDFVKGVVAGIIDGDGSIDNDSISIRVSSATLVNQLTYVLKMLGFEPSARKPQGVGSIRKHNGREIVQKYPIWCLAFGKRAHIDLPSLKYERSSVAPKSPVVREAGVVEVTHVEPVDIPDEYIYDITTESHTFMCNGIFSHNCGGHSLEYIKKYGLALPNITSVSKPAKHPEVLIGHMVKMASTLQSHYAGAVGWEAVNIFFAPFIVNLPYDKVKQLAQMLIFEFNQLAGSRGAQVTFTDFNLYYGIPRHFEDTPALGPGGKYMKRKEDRIVYYDEPVQGCLTYKDFEKEANVFLKALFDIYLEGDVTGKTFVFPKPLLHINEKFFETPGHDEFLDFACKVASKQGITYFVFDRGDSTTVSQCLHPETKILAKVGDQVFYGSIEELADKRPGWRDVDDISVFTSFGEPKKVKGVYARLETRKLLNIKLRDGSIIRATEDHPMVIRHSEMGEDHLAEARDLEIGDLIPVAKRIDLGEGKTEIDLVKEAVLRGIDLRVSRTKKRIANGASLDRKYCLRRGRIDHYKQWDRFPARVVLEEKFDYEDAKVAFRSEHNCQVPAVIKLDYDLGRFIGLYAAEGNVNKTQVRFCFNPKERGYIDFTKSFINSRLGKHTWIDRSNKWDSVVVSCSSRTIRWLQELFVAGAQAKNRRLTHRVFDANEEFRKGLVEGFLEGDGYHWKGATTIETSFHIASGDLAEDMRTLMKTLGINTTIVHRKQPNPRNREQILDSHSVRVAVDDLNKLNFGKHNYTRKNNYSIWKWNYADDRYAYLPIVSITEEDYFGLVYDFEMAEEPLFHLANGMLTHNCCRLKLRLGEKDLEETKTPEKMRFSALQNVTVNLPRIAYKARGNDELLFTELNRTLDLVARAHVGKKKFISDLIELKERGPLYMFSATQDGSAYLRMDRLTYLCGLLGLNEMVQAHLGEQLHESERALKFGLKIVSYMNLKCRQLSERYGIRMILEESPAESAAYRLAKLDMKYFPEQTSRAIKGRLEGDNYYYTNSIHLAYDAPVDYIERVEKQSLFHPLVEAGSICLSPEQKLLTFKDGKTDVLSVEQVARKYIPSDKGEEISSALTSRINLATLGADLQANKSTFTKIKAITKVPISGRRIVEVRSLGNKAVRVTADHPVPVMRKGEIIDIPAINLTRKDTLLVASKPKRKTVSRYYLFDELLNYAEQIFVVDVNSAVKSYLKKKGLLTNSLRQIHKGSLNFKKVLDLVPKKQVEEWAKKNLIMWKMKNSNDRLPFTLIADENLGHFFGFMVSEGHKQSNNSGALKRSLYNVGATFSCDEKKYQDLFREAVKESFGLKMHRSTENGSHTTISIGSKSLHFLLTHILDIGENALSRKIPEQLYSFGDKFLLSMLDAMFAGDGTSTKEYIVYNTQSEELKSGLGLVCTLLGVRTAFWKQGIAIQRDEAMRLQSSMSLFAAKSFLGNKRRSVTNGAWLTTESTPFSYLHFKYAQQGLGRALEPVRRGKLYRAKAYKKIIATSTALKYARKWLKGLNSLSRMEDSILCRVLRKEDIAMAVGASSDYVRHVLGGRDDSLQYEHAWSSKKEILSSVHLFAEEIRNDIRRDIDKLKKFIQLLKSDINFEPLKSVEIVEDTPPYVYDLTTECGLFAAASGILLHNCHIWLGEHEPDPKAIRNFVLKTFRNTQAEQIAFSPEFTVCEACRRTTRGLHDTCSLCGSDKVYGITRIVGYFSKVPTWNKGKSSELKDRIRTDLSEVV